MNAAHYKGDADFLFTNPYAAVPAQLHGKPSIINLFEGKGSRREWCERSCLGGAVLHYVSPWGAGGHNTIYVANTEYVPMDLAGYRESHWNSVEGRGWFPLAMCVDLLRAYAKPGMTVWDGFMGRGTVGAACRILGMNFIGIDISQERVDLAHRYLKEKEQ